MIKTTSLLATVALMSAAFAERYQIHESKFEQKVSLTGLATPLESAEVSISPKVWKDFVIASVVPHGTKVKKGEQIISIDTKKCDDYLKVQAKERELDTIKLENAKKELEELRVATARALDETEQKFARELQDYTYYTEVLVPEKLAALSLERDSAGWHLDNVQEELNQLLKMYAEDGLTEETEEIIIHRQKNSVKIAEHNKSVADRKYALAVEVTMPREQKDQKRKLEQSEINRNISKRALEKALNEKEIVVAKMIIEEEQKAKAYADVLADREAMVIVSPLDGYVYYGEFKDHVWDKEQALKVLKEGNSLPVDKKLLTVVPETAKMLVSASVDSAVTRNIEVGSVGQMRINDSPWHRFKTHVSYVSETPNVQGLWSVALNSELPEGFRLKAGESVIVNFTTYENERAITIPEEALKEEADGSFTVLVKMTDGETRKTVVTLGKSSDGKVEVLSGLSPGWVIHYGVE